MLQVATPDDNLHPGSARAATELADLLGSLRSIENTSVGFRSNIDAFPLLSHDSVQQFSMQLLKGAQTKSGITKAIAELRSALLVADQLLPRLYNACTPDHTVYEVSKLVQHFHKIGLPVPADVSDLSIEQTVDALRTMLQVTNVDHVERLQYTFPMVYLSWCIYLVQKILLAPTLTERLSSVVQKLKAPAAYDEDPRCPPQLTKRARSELADALVQVETDLDDYVEESVSKPLRAKAKDSRVSISVTSFGYQFYKTLWSTTGRPAPNRLHMSNAGVQFARAGTTVEQQTDKSKAHEAELSERLEKLQKDKVILLIALHEPISLQLLRNKFVDCCWQTFGFDNFFRTSFLKTQIRTLSANKNSVENPQLILSTDFNIVSMSLVWLKQHDMPPVRRLLVLGIDTKNTDTTTECCGKVPGSKPKILWFRLDQNTKPIQKVGQLAVEDLQRVNVFRSWRTDTEQVVDEIMFVRNANRAHWKSHAVVFHAKCPDGAIHPPTEDSTKKWRKEIWSLSGGGGGLVSAPVDLESWIEQLNSCGFNAFSNQTSSRSAGLGDSNVNSADDHKEDQNTELSDKLHGLMQDNPNQVENEVTAADQEIELFSKVNESKTLLDAIRDYFGESVLHVLHVLSYMYSVDTC